MTNKGPILLERNRAVDDSYYNSLSPRVGILGGGTGTYNVASALKEPVGDGLFTSTSMADDGGSSGELTNDFGTLPPGDVRQCLIAQANNEFWRSVYSRRETDDTKIGKTKHSQGNLILQLMQNAGATFEEAVDESSRVLQITGRTLPATLEKRTLVVTPLGGEPIIGEHNIGETNVSLRGAKIGFLEGPAMVNPRAAAAVESAEMIVIAPGSEWTSTLPALMPEGMIESIMRARENGAVVVHFANLMHDNHTEGMDALDHTYELQSNLSHDFVDVLVYSTDEVNPQSLAEYAAKGETLVPINEQRLRQQKLIRVIGAPLLAEAGDDAKPEKGGLVRHDPIKLGKTLMRIYHEIMAQRY